MKQWQKKKKTCIYTTITTTSSAPQQTAAPATKTQSAPTTKGKKKRKREGKGLQKGGNRHLRGNRTFSVSPSPKKGERGKEWWVRGSERVGKRGGGKGRRAVGILYLSIRSLSSNTAFPTAKDGFPASFPSPHNTCTHTHASLTYASTSPSQVRVDKGEVEAGRGQ